MPMMPMEPANAVMSVRPFLVMRFLNDRASAVRNDMRVRRAGFSLSRMSSAVGSIRVAVGADDAVGQVHDARGVLFGQLGIVRDHDDQAVVCDFREQVHDLDARLGVERAGGLVGQQDLRVVDEGARDGDALHLPAGKLAGLLVHVLGQAHAPERVQRPLAALGARHARQRERQLHVGQHGLVRDEVVALEHEADAVVAVGVPVAVLVLLGGNAVDDQVARIVMVKPAHDVQQRGLARARRPQDGHELVVAERHGHVVERHLGERACRVRLADMVQLKHGPTAFLSSAGLPFAGAGLQRSRRRSNAGRPCAERVVSRCSERKFSI